MKQELRSLWRRLSSGEADRAGDSAARWVVVDTETSGLDPERDRLLAIGAVAVDAAGIIPADSFEVVLGGEAAGDPANIAIHGIGHGAQLAGEPPAGALAAFVEWMAGAPCAAYHADFDRRALGAAFVKAGLAAIEDAWLDLAPLATALSPEGHRHRKRSLDDWLTAFGIECPTRHNAAADAFATAELLLRLRSMAARQGTHGFDALVRVARQQRWLGL